MIMLYMNDYDRAYALRRFGRGNTPRRHLLATLVDALADWADHNSDGWAYWLAPRRAALRAMELVKSTTNDANDAQERQDCSEAEYKAALRPLKTFSTRHGARLF
jgi:hypothetical protein